MSKPEQLKIALTWRFTPVEAPVDKSIRWAWVAHTHSGSVAAQSNGSFETLSECTQDAASYGYTGRVIT